MSKEEIPDMKDWTGDERREYMRRYSGERRVVERRKKYWWSVVLPIILGLLGTGVISWAVYVTHTTYGISAKWEQSFGRHVQDQLQKEASDDHRIELMKIDHNSEMTSLRRDMNEGFKEIRGSQKDIYNLLLKERSR